MKYQNKYLKYKKKYLELKGGFNFEEFYDFFIDACMSFNSYMSIFEKNVVLHIKGGASVKYHLNKSGIDTTDITNDIDILFIYKDKNIQEILDKFMKFIQGKKRDNYEIRKVNDILYNLYLDNNCVVDITFFKLDVTEDNLDDTHFGEALAYMNYLFMNDYMDEINNIEIEEIEDIENKTFSSLYLEKVTNEISLKNYEEWMNNVPKMKDNVQKNIFPRHYTEEQKKRKRYEISDSYQLKIKDKIERYKKKLELIDSVLKIDE
jgi:hypothetical protein